MSNFDKEEAAFDQLTRMALDSLHHGLCITDGAGRIRYANPAAQRIYGFAVADLIGKSMIDLAAESDRSLIINLLADFCGQERWRGDVTLHRGDNHKVVVQMSISVLCDGNGTARGFVFTSHDLTERRLLEENLRQAQKLEAVGLLASGLAHNINSPLAAIIITAEMAQARFPDMKEFKDIMQAADRIQEIVANLMTKSRQEQSTEEIDIDLNQLVKTELKFLEANLFFKHQVSANLSLAPELPRIRGIYSDFSQCFYNLVQNALDAMQGVEDRRLTVKTGLACDKNAIFLSVHDTGCGIAREHLQRIFEPFFTTKLVMSGDLEQSKPSGTGLGLSTTKYLLTRYGAAMEVASEIGQGTEFRVSIPVAPGPGQD
jgi:PAS domain S-box-containing protein